MNRGIEIGDRVICRESGVVGEVLRFYTPTASDEQTMVMTDDGREYHAPTNTWVVCDSKAFITTMPSFDNNAYNEAFNKVAISLGVSFKESCVNIDLFNQERRQWYGKS